jgi:hypothetical protein
MYSNQPGVGVAPTQMQAGLGNQQLGSTSMMGMPPQMYGGGSQAAMMYPQQMPVAPQQPMYGGGGRLAGYMQHPAVAAAHYYSNLGTAGMYGYPGANGLSQSMYGLSVQDNSSYQTKTAPPSAVMKPEDKLFGDLLSIAKTKKAS